MKGNYNTKLRQAEKHLSENDKRLEKLIIKFGKCSLKPDNNYYLFILNVIISQQLSAKAAETIFNRFIAKFKPKPQPLPEHVLEVNSDELRNCGMSYSKIKYVKDLSQKILNKEIDLVKLKYLSDEDAIKELTKVKGIGRWTAEMVLIFSLFRLNVLPTDDQGIKNGVKRIYGFDRNPDADDIIKISKKNKWSPYNSVACWYIWRSLENK